VISKAALETAGLRSLRFHDLRHTFGTRTIAKADIRRVQEWMGHADVQTTMRYLHYAPRAEDARLVAEAFEVDEIGGVDADLRKAERADLQALVPRRAKTSCQSSQDGVPRTLKEEPCRGLVM
jgi:hypothetical protein